MTETRVHADKVTVSRGGVTLLDDVSMRASAGAIIGIVGPSGAGKSTLLRVLSGSLVPDHGTTTLLDSDVAAASLQRLARIRSYVGPQRASDVRFRVGEVVAMGRRPNRSDVSEEVEGERVVAAAMNQVDIAHLAGRIVRTLSSGEQQRVELARAIAQQTPIILLDEPTSALDVGHQEMVMAALGDLADGGATIVAVLHDLNLAAAHADRVVLIDQGQVRASGTPQDVFTGSRLSSAYREPIEVVDHPFRDCPLVLTTGH